MLAAAPLSAADRKAAVRRAVEVALLGEAALPGVPAAGVEGSAAAVVDRYEQSN